MFPEVLLNIPLCLEFRRILISSKRNTKGKLGKASNKTNLQVTDWSINGGGGAQPPVRNQNVLFFKEKNMQKMKWKNMYFYEIKKKREVCSFGPVVRCRPFWII